MDFSENFSLKSHNTFGVDVKSRLFIKFESVMELKEIISSDTFNNNKNLILGEGSNLLFTQDYDGLIIHNKIAGICISEDNDNNIIVDVCGCCESLFSFC